MRMETSLGTEKCSDGGWVMILVVPMANEFVEVATGQVLAAVWPAALSDIPSYTPIKVIQNYIKSIFDIIDIATFCRGATTVFIHNYSVNR